jgi:hypothetical protein
MESSDGECDKVVAEQWVERQGYLAANTMNVMFLINKLELTA